MLRPSFLLFLLNLEFMRVIVRMLSILYWPDFLSISTSDMVCQEEGENPNWYGREQFNASNSAMVGSCAPAM